MVGLDDPLVCLDVRVGAYFRSNWSYSMLQLLPFSCGNGAPNLRLGGAAAPLGLRPSAPFLLWLCGMWKRYVACGSVMWHLLFIPLLRFWVLWRGSSHLEA